MNRSAAFALMGFFVCTFPAYAQRTGDAVPPLKPRPATPADPLLAPEESPCLANVRQLTSPAIGLQKAGEAYFAPDGRRIIFQAVPAGNVEYQIYTLDLKDEGIAKPESLRMVSTGAGACTCSFFRPDGKRILFASSHLDPRLQQSPRPKEDEAYRSERGYRWDFNEWMEIFEADPDGDHRTRLTDVRGYDAECAYSPDARQIVFASNRTGDVEVYLMNADGSSPLQITRAKGYDGGPFFSPDGTRIVYRSDRRGDGNMQIFTNNLAGTDEVRLTDNDVLNWCPFWHPSGRYVIFTEGRHNGPPRYDLYLLPVDPQKALAPDGRFRVTHHPRFDGLPVFSPDGRRVMWTSKRGPDDTSQVFLADFTAPSGY